MAIVMKKSTMMALCMAALLAMATALSSCNAQGDAAAREAAGPLRTGDGKDGCYLLNFPWCRTDMCIDLTKDKNAYCNDKGECCPSTANSTAATSSSSYRKSLRQKN